ncbi:M48 family metalloprotease [Haloplanus pelagicus]|jgi:heat shock protein HtpX|uniref:M48 family metalloprotease n=1 Tax=Haloplanus pelagicus TaxID=2949995 RepID=UPI00203CD79C|nr:M48 family metalloprotease [Haloplanus sp. HW8-1]
MRDLSLTIRMGIASTVLMGVYALIGLLLFAIGGIWVAVVGLPLLVVLQYLITVQFPLWTEESREITPEDHPELHDRADRIADELDIPKPKMYLIESDRLNAFALGRRGSGKVFLHRGLVQRMSLDELEPIVAHEFAHLRNRDSILMGLGTSIVTIVSSGLFILFLLASLDSDRPWLMRLVGAAVSVCVHFFLLVFVGMVSRYREYVADEDAVRATGRYDGMRSALEKLRSEKRRVDDVDMSASRSAISFVDFSGGIASSLLATHPSLDKRISRIERLESETEEISETGRVSSQEAVDASGTNASATTLSELSDDQLLATLQSMDEYEFEHLVAELWNEIGWRTSVTTASVDRGIDVIAEQDSPFPQKQIIQAKRYSSDNPVSSSEVQQYAGLYAQEDDVDAVIVVTTGRFTSNASEVAVDSNVKLVDGDDLCKLIREVDRDFSLAD